MKKVVLIIIYFFVGYIACSQNYKLKILKKVDLSNFVVGMSLERKKNNALASDSLIILKNGYKLTEYKIFKITLQNNSSNKYNTIKFLVGYNINEMIMAVDNNRNSNFSDDSIYTYEPEKTKMTNRELRNSLPVIKVDSLEIIDEKGNPFYYSTNVRFCPTLKMSEAFSGYTDMPKDNNHDLLIFKDSSYYTENFVIENSTYHLEIIPQSIIYPVYPINNSDFSTASINLIKHVTQDSLTLVGFQIIEFMLLRNKEMTFENQFFKLLDYNFSSKNIEFEIKKTTNLSDSNLFYLSKFKYQSVKDKKMHSISLSKSKYTVMEFGGSWCKPCNEIIPQIEKFNLIKGDSINFISIFKEGNLANAIKYYKFVKPKWDAYFEPLKCDSKDCLSSLFDVGVYPVIILLDNKGNLLFRANGSNCVNELELFLKWNQPKKDI